MANVSKCNCNWKNIALGILINKNKRSVKQTPLIIGVGKKMFNELQKGLILAAKAPLFMNDFIRALIAIHSSLWAD